MFDRRRAVIICGMPDRDQQRLPRGVVTFLLTDVADSTGLWANEANAALSMARQRQLIADAVAAHGGVRPVEQGEGDSLVAAFVRATDGIAAALDAQLAIQREDWPGRAVRVRMAVHTGEAQLQDEHTYGGTAIIRCARLRDLAAGGQVLVSAAAAAVAADSLPPETHLLDAGAVSLRGLGSPDRVHVLLHPQLEATFAAPRSSRRLGSWPSSMVGRSAERCDVAALLDREQVITITGAGGAGKSRLAHAIASDLVDRYDDVAWVELGEVADGDDVAASVARACGAGEAPGASTTEVLTRFLDGKSFLIVLDNCEHLLDASAAMVDAIVRGAASVRVLATSREPLGVSSEVSWRIPSLTTPPEHVAPHDVAAYDAAALFVDRARTADPRFTVDEASAPLIAAICRRLDGLPLALELAAARVRSMPLAAVAGALDDRFRLLTGGARTALARHRTLLASVEWSHDLLDEDERTLLRRLSVFRAPFTVEAVETVASDDGLDHLELFDVLSRLVDKSLVQPIGSRYRLLETIRQFAADRAADADELELMRDNHLTWFRRRASSWRLEREVLVDATMDDIDAEAPDLLAALEWSMQRAGDPAIEVLWPLGQRWLIHSAFDEASRVSSAILDRFTAGSVEWLDALAPMASALAMGGERRWVPQASVALAQAGELVSGTTRGHVEWAASSGLTMVGGASAIAQLRGVIELGRRLGHPALELGAAAMLSHSLAAGGALDEATRLCDWLERRLPSDARISATVDVARGHLALHRCAFDDAWTAVAPHVEQRPPDLRAAVVAGLVGVYQEDRERLAIARDAFGRTAWPGAYELWRAQLAAYAAVLAGDLETARAEVDAFRPAPTSEYQLQIAGRLRIQLALALDDVDSATEIAAALRPLPDTQATYGAATIDLTLADIAIHQSERREAEEHVQRALSRIDGELAIVTVDALELLAVLLFHRGRPNDAARMLGATEAFRHRTGLRWRLPNRRGRVDAVLGASEPADLAEGGSLSLDDALRLARGTRGKRGRPSFGWDSLTPTEARVVELVAEGLTNQAIADKLFVGIATVKTHLVHIYGKLAIRTRAELAATVARRASRDEQT